jgi:hypothetical protein
MLNAHLGTRRRLAALAGLLVTVALTAAPTAVAVPLMPDGEPVPRLDQTPGQSDPAPFVHTSSNGLDWGQVGVAVAVGLITALVIAAAVFALAGRRRVRLADR